MRFCSVILLSLLFFSCQEEPEVIACDVNISMIGEIEWLQIEIEEMKGAPTTNGVVLYSFNGKYVIELQRSTASSTNQSQFYCDGTKLDFNDYEDFNEYLQSRIELKVLFGTKIWD